MEEIWKEIIGYDGAYAISNFGRVKSHARTVTSTKNKNFNYKTTEKILKPNKYKNGYLWVGLMKDGLCEICRIHRLVSKHFLDNPQKKPHVNHKDANRKNNCVWNLEWCTRSENMLHAYRVTKIKHSMVGKFGKLHHRSIPIIQLSQNGKFIKRWENMRLAAKKLNCSISCICHALKKKTKTARGFVWIYDDGKKFARYKLK